MVGHSKSHAESSTWDKIRNIVLTVAQNLQSDVTPQLSLWFEQMAALGAADAQGALNHMFTEKITLQSPIFKVFQAIHQSILFPAIYRLKTNVFAELPLKDVRSADGWGVDIMFDSIHAVEQGGVVAGQDTRRVVITHHRREQSLEVADHADHFHVSWELRMTFDSQLSQMNAALLRLTGVQFNDNASAEHRAMVMSKLHSENILV
jgi:hypothetical protein